MAKYSYEFKKQVVKEYVSVIHQKITTDISEFKYYEIVSKGRMNIKKLYLDSFMDMYNSEIIAIT